MAVWHNKLQLKIKDSFCNLLFMQSTVIEIKFNLKEQQLLLYLSNIQFYILIILIKFNYIMTEK